VKGQYRAAHLAGCCQSPWDNCSDLVLESHPLEDAADTVCKTRSTQLLKEQTVCSRHWTRSSMLLCASERCGLTVSRFPGLEKGTSREYRQLPGHGLQLLHLANSREHLQNRQ
jgi:hypothetical protein